MTQAQRKRVSATVLTALCIMIFLAAVYMYFDVFKHRADAEEGVLRMVPDRERMEVHFSGSGTYKGAEVICGEVMPELGSMIRKPPQRFVYLIKRRSTILYPAAAPMLIEDNLFYSEIWRVACENTPQQDMDNMIKQVEDADAALDAIDEQIAETEDRAAAGEIGKNIAAAQLRRLNQQRDDARQKYNGAVREASVY